MSTRENNFMKDFICLVTLFMSVWTIIILITTASAVDNENITVRTDITSMVLESETEGSFFICFGYVGNDECYFVYARDENGKEKLLKLSTETTYLSFTLPAGEQAYMIETKDRFGWGMLLDRTIYLPEDAKKQYIDLSLEQIGGQ